MKQTLLCASGNVKHFNKTTNLQLLLFILTLWCSTIQDVKAQACNGPYQVFESVPDNFPAMTGWTSIGGFDVLPDPTGIGFTRSGLYALVNLGGAGDTVETPIIADPLNFSFYASPFSLTPGGGYQLFVKDGTHAWQDVALGSTQTNYGISAAVLPTLAGIGTWDLISVTFGGTPAGGYSNSNLQFAIMDDTDSLALDDFSWTSRTSANNNIFIPLLGAPSSCTQLLSTGSVYTLYDNGGASDNYAHSQNNSITFTAATPGDVIEITFNAFSSEPLTDYITVTGATVPLSMHSGGMPGTVTYTSTAGSITINFYDDDFNSSTTFAGYDITVECISGTSCFPPTALAFAGSGGFSHNQAFLTWTASGTATGYEVYYSTSNTAPTGATVANGGTPVSNSATVSGLSSSTLYYFWVRSDCGAGGKSTWLGPISATTLCTPQTVTYIEAFNSLPNGTIPTCSSRTSIAWGANNTNGILSCNAIGESFFTQGVSLTAGQLYRLSYDYASNGNGTADLEVFYGHPTNSTAPTVSNINTAVAYNGGFSNVATNIVNFTAATTGTYYIRFVLDGLSIPATGALYLDNVRLEIESCLAPSFPGTPVTGVNDNGATIAWNVPVTGPPSNGYYYYLSTSNTPPSYTDTATGVVASTGITLSTLSPNTTYYFWVRSNCGGQISVWTSAFATFTTTNVTAPTVIRISDTTTPYSVACGANITFTDSGGTGGNYTNYERTAVFDPYSYTFVPTTPGSKLMVIFNSFRTEATYDGLMIYSGTSSAGTLMSSGVPEFNAARGNTCPTGAYSGSALPPNIISTAADGSLTFEFRSDVSLVYAGWTASIVCISNPPSITSFTPTDNSCGASSVSVVITGANFTGITGVTFNGISASYVVNSATQITATLPATATTGRIKVLTSTVSATSATDFIVNKPAPVTTGATICVGGTGTISSATACDFWLPVASITGNLDGSGPQAPKPSGSGTTCGFSAASGYYYTAVQFMVSVSGAYTMQTTAPNVDLMGYITSGPFTVGSCATGTFIISNDDGAGNLQPLLAANLIAGVEYTLYTTTWASGVTTPSYTWTFTTPVGGNILTYQTGPVDWWDAATGGNYIGSGSPFNPVGLDPALPNTLSPGTWTYYAACSANPTCRTATTFVIGTAVGGTASSSQTICGGSFADIVLTGSTGTVTKWQYANDNLFTVGLTDIPASASATLTSAQIGQFSGTRYFRAVVTVGSCTTAYSTTATLIYNKVIWNGVSWSNGTGPTTSLGAEFTGNFTSSVHASATSGNLSTCSVKVTSGNVLFDVGTLTVQNEVSVSNVAGVTSLTFNNNTSLYQANAVTNTAGVYSGGNSGDIVYRRTTTGIRRFDYTYWSTPVDPQTLVDVSPSTPFDHYYYFNAGINNWQYIASNNLMDVGKGYIIRAPFNYDINVPANYTATFEGVPNNGTISTPIVGGAGQMNLIGNPYPSALSASAFILDPANTNVNGTIYLWTHNTPINLSYQYTGSDYAIYNLVGGTTAATNLPVGAGGNGTVPLGYIAAGQGFFIKGFSNGTATFKNSMRAAGNNSQFYRLSPFANTTDTELNLEKHRYWLNIANTEGAFKQVLIGYVETATNGIDRLFDGEMIDVGNAVTLYTLVDNTKLSIQGKELAFDVNETIPLGYKSTINTSYTINLADFDGLFDAQNIYLEDKLLNVVHDLKAAPYTFATVSGTFEERFVLRYNTETLGTTDPIFNENTVVVYQNSTGLHINTGNENMRNVTIFDVRGREIASQKQIGNTVTVFATLPTTQQVLLVKIEGENGGIVTKKVVY